MVSSAGDSAAIEHHFIWQQSFTRGGKAETFYDHSFFLQPCVDLRREPVSILSKQQKIQRLPANFVIHTGGSSLDHVNAGHRHSTVSVY